MLAGLVFLFGAWVALSLSSGQLDPIGSPYYGVVVSWRESVLFTLLGGLQVVALVDAGALARRRRAWSWWLGSRGWTCGAPSIGGLGRTA